VVISKELTLTGSSSKAIATTNPNAHQFATQGTGSDVKENRRVFS